MLHEGSPGQHQRGRKAVIRAEGVDGDGAAHVKRLERAHRHLLVHLHMTRQLERELRRISWPVYSKHERWSEKSESACFQLHLCDTAL